MGRQNTEALPNTVMFWEIMPRLPTKSLIRFKCVSKEWRNFITHNAGLKKAHSRRHRTSDEMFSIALGKRRLPFNDYSEKPFLLTDRRQTDTNISPPVAKELYMPYKIIDVIGSSNGLVLFSTSTRSCVLWNPATREFRLLPEAEIGDSNVFSARDSPILGVEVDDESNDYKIIQVSDTVKRYAHNNNNLVWSMKFQVLSKRSNSSRDLQPLRNKFQIFGREQRGVSIDGVFYFLALKEYPLKKIVILSYTFRNEEVRSIIFYNWPYRESKVHRFHPILIRWKDSLALMIGDSTDFGRSLWLRKKKDSYGGDNEFSWSKLFVLEDNHYLRGVWSGRYLIIQRVSSCSGNHELVLRDPQTAREHDISFVLVALLGFSWKFLFPVNVIDYVPTLVSLYPDC